MGAASAGGVRQVRQGFRTTALSFGREFTFGITLLIVVFLLNGCAGLVGSPAGNTQPGLLQLNPGSISFGKVGVGKQSTQNISIANAGKGAATITQVTVSNPQFTLSGMTTPLTLPGGQAASFSVSVQPTATGNMNGTLSVTSDAASNPVVVNLTATGVIPQPQISPSTSSVDFGSVSVGTQGIQSLTITNTGQADLTISMITLTGADLALGGITTPRTISAGQMVTLTLTFHPTATGSVGGNLVITSNDPTNPTVNISLTGSGTNSQVGQLAANPPNISFGNVNTGSSASNQVILTNTGNAAVKISKISASGTGFSASGVNVPATVNPSQSVTLNIGFAPTTAANQSGAITVTSDANGSPLVIALAGTGVQAGLNVSPATFNFGSVVDGQTKSQVFNVTNTGAASLTIAQISVSGVGYTVSGLSTPSTLAAGQSASFSAEFAPTTAGSRSGTVSISSNAPNSPGKVTLSGTGLAASVTLVASPTSVAFGSVNAGTSSSKSVTLTNSGNANLTISQVTVSAKDVKTSGITTPMTIAPGHSAAMNVAFTPTGAETISGNVTVTNAQGASTVIPVSGTGMQAAVTLTPATVNFGNVPVGTTYSQTILLTNSGTAVLTINQVNVAGSGFGTSGLTLPISLSPGQSSTFNLQYSPVSTGTVSGTVSIVSNAPASQGVLTVAGTGIAATKTISFSTMSLNFGNVTTGGFASEGVTITSTGDSDVLISQIGVNGAGFSLSGASTPVTLAPMQSLTMAVAFSPTATGSANGSVTVTSNATGSPATITLSGSGVQASTHTVALTWDASTSTVSGYNIYRSTTSGSGYLRINSSLVPSLSYTDSTLQSATTYYYVTTAVDANGNESSTSNEAQAIIP